MNITPNFSPEIGDNKGGKIEKEKKPLAVAPIFRANDLYCAMFPEVKPLFNKGEQPDAKKIFEAILQHKGQKVELDYTCMYELSQIKELEVIPIELSLAEVPMNGNKLDLKVIERLLSEKYGITFINYQGGWCTIDDTINQKTGFGFSPEVASVLVEIAKQKNPGAKKIYIIRECLEDHVAGNFSEDEIVQILTEEVKKAFGVEPIVVPELDRIIEKAISDPSVHIIKDRHAGQYDFVDEHPKQVSSLPLITELHKNEEFLQLEAKEGGLAAYLREAFEVTD